MVIRQCQRAEAISADFNIGGDMNKMAFAIFIIICFLQGCNDAENNNKVDRIGDEKTAKEVMGDGNKPMPTPGKHIGGL